MNINNLLLTAKNQKIETTTTSNVAEGEAEKRNTVETLDFNETSKGDLKSKDTFDISSSDFNIVCENGACEVTLTSGNAAPDGNYEVNTADGEVTVKCENGECEVVLNDDNTSNTSATNSSATAVSATATTSANALNQVTATGSVPTDAEIEAMITQKEVNEETIKKLQDRIKKIVEEVKAEIAEALAEQENIQEEQKEEIQRIVDEKLQEYQDANGEMTLEDFRAGVTTAISTSSSTATRALESTVSTIMSANQNLNLIDSLLVNINELLDQNATLDSQIAAAKQAQEAAKGAKTTTQKGCDPISFNLNGAQYDFIIDDGAFDSANDFLGANNYFTAMQNLDTNADGKVTKNELEAGNIKLVKTQNGVQNVVDVDTVFDNDDSVNLSSYENLTTVSNAQSLIATGQDNVTLGTFNLTLGGDNQTIDGVSTLDSSEFLNDTYGFDNITTDTEYASFLEEYSEITAELRTELNKASSGIGITSSQLQNISAISKAKANAEAVKITNDIKSVATKEVEDKKAQETKANALTTSANSTSGTTGVNKTHSIQELTKDNLSILDDDTGTSFIYIWNTGCGRCKRTIDYWQEAAANIDNANFYSLNYSDVGNRPLDNLLDQCENLKSNAITFPAIIRCENGKPVYFISTKKVYANENLEQLLREEMSS